MSEQGRKHIAIVTGAAGNLGQAVAQIFLREGCTVIGTTHNSNSLQHHSHDRSFETVPVDLLNEAACREFVAAVKKKYGRINVAILTAGGFTMGTVAGTTTSDISRQYQLNFETAYNIAQPVFVQMLQQNSGSIFLTGSKPGLSTAHSKGMAAYSLSKSLLFRLADLMNEEAKGHNVITRVLVPDIIDTPQNRQALPAADFSKWLSPEAIAAQVWNHYKGATGKGTDAVIKLYDQP
jgi:NAD(P)-dependent dehydrogenase (short-subunit alcohol dehydrogenase family)